VVASFFWQIFATVVYFSKKNYLAASPFIINCDERFDKGSFCQDKLLFLEGESFNIIRILSMAVFIFLLFIFCLCGTEKIRKEQGISKNKVKSVFRLFF